MTGTAWVGLVLMLTGLALVLGLYPVVAVRRRRAPFNSGITVYLSGAALFALGDWLSP